MKKHVMVAVPFSLMHLKMMGLKPLNDFTEEEKNRTALILWYF